MSLKGAKVRRTGEGSFWLLDLIQISSRGRGAEEMWESVLSISKVLGKAIGGFFPVGFSMDRHFLGAFSQLSVSPGEAQFFKQLAFCLLHTARGLCIAEGAGDALQGVDAN